MKRNDEPATVGDVRALGEVFDTLTVAAAKLEDRLGALEKRMDVLVYARSAVPYDFPASDVRAGMAPAGFTVATTPPADEPPAPVPWDGILWGQIRDWSKAFHALGQGLALAVQPPVHEKDGYMCAAYKSGKVWIEDKDGLTGEVKPVAFMPLPRRPSRPTSISRGGWT